MSYLHDILAWLLSSELGRDKLALLILCSLSMYALGTNLAWRIGLDKSWSGRLAVQLARLLYYLIVPSVVLWRGAIVSQMGIPTTYAGGSVFAMAFRLLGLAQARDVLLIGQGLALGIAALCLLVAVWAWYARTVSPPAGETSMPWWVALREATYYQMHWALYRGFVASLTPDRTVIAFASLGLVAFGWVLSPQRRHDLFSSRGYLVVQDWVCALLTTFVLLSVQTLWLLMAMHVLWLWIGGRARAHFVAASGQRYLLSQGGDQSWRFE